MWVVDTCVLIDLLRRDEAFATCAADALDSKRTEGLTIAPLTYVELAPALGGDVRAQDYFLSEIGISIDFEGKKDIVLSAFGANAQTASQTGAVNGWATAAPEPTSAMLLLTRLCWSGSPPPPRVICAKVISYWLIALRSRSSRGGFLV